MSKQKYRVTQPNTLTYKVGDIVELTEVQAKRLVNKVEPAPKSAPKRRKKQDS